MCLCIHVYILIYDTVFYLRRCSKNFLYFYTLGSVSSFLVLHEVEMEGGTMIDVAKMTMSSSINHVIPLYLFTSHINNLLPYIYIYI